MEPINCRGQSTIETLVVLPAVIACLGGLLFTLYLLVALAWCDHWVYRASICLAEGESRWHCEVQLQQKISLVIPAGFFLIEEMWGTPREVKVGLRLALSDHYVKRIHSRLQLPLEPLHPNWTSEVLQ